MLPSAAPVPALRQTTDAFPGLDCRPRPVAGACAALKNLVGGEYPVLSSRPGRGTVATLRDPGGLLAKDALCYVDGGSLYVNGYAVDAMRWAVSSGIIGGTDAGLLMPQGNATRAQVATMLMRFVEGLTK